jgi:S-layer homology domain
MPRSVSRRLAVLLAAAALAIGIPLGVVIAGATFSDVPSSNPFYNDITAIANAGVTTGCGGGKFCPKDTVTREQMAAFMNRLGALSAGNTPVVNADKLDGLNSTDFLRSNRILNGKASSLGAGNRILLDSTTGADVQTTSGGRFSIKNTSSSLTMYFHGLCTADSNIGATFGSIAPGATVEIVCVAAFDSYVDLLLVLQGDTVSGTRTAHLTCSNVDSATPSKAVTTCVLVR